MRPRRNNHLNDQQLERLASSWYESEDELDFSADECEQDPTFAPPVDSSSENDSDNLPPEHLIQPKHTVHHSPPPPPQPSTSRGITNSSEAKPAKVNVIWKKKHLELIQEQLSFLGDDDLPNDFLQLETPYQFFSYFFTDEVVDHIRDQTNIYSVQKDPNKPINIEAIDVRQFVGVVLYTSVVRILNVRNYWSDKMGITIIKETMPLKKFERLRQTFHFNDNSKMLPYTQPGSDRLYKVRPLIEKLNKRFSTVVLERYLAVDEQMCSTKARSILKQYMPAKPHKWGFKLFILCGVSGFGYNFEIYSGQENILEEGEPQLGASSNIVMRLARKIPNNSNYRLYFDNYYTSLPLIEHLARRGIHSLGTVRKNRIPNCKLPDESFFRKQPRGTSVEFVGDHNGIQISTTAWKDNKIVSLASNFAGKNPTSNVQRYDRVNKVHISVERPFVVAEYNRHMGGVDLMDSIIARHKILLRSKFWYMRLFYHLLDMVMANAWLLYRRVNKQAGRSENLSAADFRMEVAESLCKVGMKQRASKRTSDVEQGLQAKKKKGPAQHAPPKEVRLDQTSHWPIWGEKRIRCKMPNCTGFTQTLCEKCGVGLCNNKTNNCFKDFHCK
ncbi:piggyBac transposable element-derived protein 3-like [Eupeodes corollae]|uniref:piggyBac transposable element-derived protein 3-like n=1 Tax=Eupeodes corollae TaxID=290404 RepID=UPI002490DD9B|nr:piggyBac transposable element-derived protein 3-like [Eupeodes corollae]